MAPSTHIQSLISRNAAITTYQSPPSLTQLSTLFATNPSIPRTLIVSCADPRCHPETIFALDPSNPSDAAIVVRVQGGDWLTALPAVMAIDSLLHFTDVVLMKHTDCVSGVFRDEDIKKQAKDRVAGNSKAVKEVDGMRFGENTMSMEDAVRRDVGLVRGNELLSEAIRGNVTGLLFHLDSGKVEVVE